MTRTELLNKTFTVTKADFDVAIKNIGEKDGGSVSHCLVATALRRQTEVKKLTVGIELVVIDGEIFHLDRRTQRLITNFCKALDSNATATRVRESLPVKFQLGTGRE